MVIYPNEEATDYISTSRLALYNYICSNNVSFLVNFNFKRNKITRVVTNINMFVTTLVILFLLKLKFTKKETLFEQSRNDYNQ